MILNRKMWKKSVITKAMIYIVIGNSQKLLCNSVATKEKRITSQNDEIVVEHFILLNSLSLPFRIEQLNEKKIITFLSHSFWVTL